MCAPSPMLSNRRVLELSNLDLGGGPGGMGCPAPSDRRGSGTSSLSSAYTVSRRSSMVSSYLSSRRSSEVSQVGGAGGQLQGILGQDPGGHPLSPESGRLPGLPSLTPAQQYSLKAKYAAATGGPPPTPLPNMEPQGPPRRMGGGFSSDYQYPPFLHQGSSARRHSANTEYGTGVLYPHQAPGNAVRRASDPAGAEPQPLSRVQRFGSLGNVALQAAGGRRNALAHCGSDSGLSNRHAYPPRPPSITENVVMEAVGAESAGGDNVMMAPPGGHRAYGGYQNHQTHPPHHQGAASQLSPAHEGLGFPEQGYFSGDMGVEEGMSTGASLLQQAEYSMSACQLSPSGPQYPSTLGQGGREAGLGTGPWGSHAQIPQGPQGGVQYQTQQGMFPGNPQKLVIKPEQQYHPALGAPSQCQNMKQHVSPPCYAQQAAPRPSHSSCDFQGQAQMDPHPSQQQSPFLGCDGRRSHTPMMQVKEMMVRNYVQSQQALLWEQQQRGVPDGGMARKGGVVEDMEMSRQGLAMQQQQEDSPHHHQHQHLQQQQTQQQQHLALYSGGNAYQGYPTQNLMSPPVGQPKDQLMGLSGYDLDMVVPRPPQGRKPPSRQNSLSQPPPQGVGYLSSPPHLSPTHSSTSPRRVVRLPPVPQPHPDPMVTANPALFYSGQIHMHLDLDKQLRHQEEPQTPCLNHMGVLDGKSASLAYPPDPAPMSNALDNLDLDSAQIDFAAIVDDPEEPPPFGPLHPSSASQTSSRLTTPQTSLSLPPGGLSNMAVGDMTSMLTSLAGENKYLNTLS